jgi:hypothetical protein
VDADSRLVVATGLVNTPVDPEQVEPMLERFAQLPEALGKPDKLLGDAGFSARRTSSAASGARSCPTWLDAAISTMCPGRNARPSEPLPAEADPVQRMEHRLKTPEGRALYALRKQLPEPVFGIIKQAMGFRQLLGGLEKTTGEWQPVALAYNFRRLHVPKA